MIASRIFPWVALIFAFFLLPPERAYAQQYALQQRDVGSTIILRVYNRSTNSTVWSRRCVGVSRASWSQDHRSLTVEVGSLYEHPSDVSQFRLLVWRAGSPVRLLGHPEKFADFDALTNLRWSHDGRRFAFLGGSTAFESGGPYIGTLCCVDAMTGRFAIGPSEVGSYQWQGSRRLLYVPVNYVRDRKHTNGEYVRVTERPRYWSGSASSQR